MIMKYILFLSLTTLVLGNANPKYIVVEQKKYWADAKAYCKNTYGTGLATIITDSDIQEASAALLAVGRKGYVYIGLDLYVEGCDMSYKYDDGTEIPLDAGMWCSGQPTCPILQNQYGCDWQCTHNGNPAGCGIFHPSDQCISDGSCVWTNGVGLPFLCDAPTKLDIAGCYGGSYIGRNAAGSNRIKVQIPNRAAAYGRFYATTDKGRVNFQDDEKYKLTFDSYSGIIDWDGLSRPWAGDRKRAWDGSNNWRKTLPDMAGHYHHISATNKNCGAAISRTYGKKIEIDMTMCTSRPKATGYVNCPTGAGEPFTGSVNFPDDKRYRFAYFPDEGKIYWDGIADHTDTNNIWVLDQGGNAYDAGFYFDPFVNWEDGFADEVWPNDNDHVWNLDLETEELELFSVNDKQGVISSSYVYQIVNNTNLLLATVGVLLVFVSVVYCGYKMKNQKDDLSFEYYE